MIGYEFFAKILREEKIAAAARSFRDLRWDREDSGCAFALLVHMGGWVRQWLNASVVGCSIEI